MRFPVCWPPLRVCVCSQAEGSWSKERCCAVQGNECGSAYCYDRASSSDYLYRLSPGEPERYEVIPGGDAEYQQALVESQVRALQVELAQLRYLSTRLVRGWSHLERQRGGIGLRGPGETQLETDRRLLGAGPHLRGLSAKAYLCAPQICKRQHISSLIFMSVLINITT